MSLEDDEPEDDDHDAVDDGQLLAMCGHRCVSHAVTASEADLFAPPFASDSWPKL